MNSWARAKALERNKRWTTGINQLTNSDQGLWITQSTMLRKLLRPNSDQGGGKALKDEYSATISGGQTQFILVRIKYHQRSYQVGRIRLVF